MLFGQYCEENDLLIDLQKRHTILFSRKISYRDVNSDLYIDNVALNHYLNIKDLDVILDAKLYSEMEVEEIVRKARSNLGFIFQVYKGYTKLESLCLYIIGTVIWNLMLISECHYYSVEKFVADIRMICLSYSVSYFSNEYIFYIFVSARCKTSKSSFSPLHFFPNVLWKIKKYN